MRAKDEGNKSKGYIMTVKEAVVLRIEKKSVLLLPILSPKCATCHERCLLRGRIFRAVNRKKLSLKKGSIVTVGTTSALEGFLGVVSLVIPILCAFLGYFLAKDKEESSKALYAFSFLLISTLLLFILNRTLYRWHKGEILEVL